MRHHKVQVHPAGQPTPAHEQLAWRIAQVAAEDHEEDPAVTEMVANRIIDNVAVAIAAINRPAVANARAQALAHPRPNGAAVLGIDPAQRFDCTWAAWANATAVRELDFHDSFFASDSSHPGDTIMPLIAVAQQCGCSGRDLVRAIATAYEIQVGLTRSVELSVHRIDHVAHLGPAVAAGLGALLRLDIQTIYQAVQLAAFLSYTTRQVRKGTISSWKAYAPAHVGKLAIEAVDRAMRGETAPSPIYEGSYGLIAILLAGPEAVYDVDLPEAGEPLRAILETYTKEHSAGYHGQALIDLAFRMRSQISDFEAIKNIEIHTKRLTHMVMGSGSGDPEKYDPEASRETLDHSAMFIFAIALQDGTWHHEASYDPQRVRRADTVRLWRKIRTVEDAEWTRRFESPPPLEKDHGARVVITYHSGEVLTDEIAVADSHPRGARPFSRPDYLRKFRTLSEGMLEYRECEKFLEKVQQVIDLASENLDDLNPTVLIPRLEKAERNDSGIF